MHCLIGADSCALSSLLNTLPVFMLQEMRTVSPFDLHFSILSQKGTRVVCHYYSKARRVTSVEGKSGHGLSCEAFFHFKDGNCATSV